MRGTVKGITPDFNVAFVGTYVPRLCGIATFTNDIATSVAKWYPEDAFENRSVRVVAMSNGVYSYPREVFFDIREKIKVDYIKAAEFINISNVNVVSLQHEFGIYGGEHGSYVLDFLKNLKKPVVTTLHTVLEEPVEDQKRVLEEICDISSRIIVCAQKAQEILEEVYRIPSEKISMIYHGAPDVPFMDPSYYKDMLNLEGKTVILTFGLLGPSKGIEYGIEALSKVHNDYPNAVYVVLGATHPEVKRLYGESYRIGLQKMAYDEGIADNVIFIDRYVSFEELMNFLIMADIYITPYLSIEQIVSGTLTYAIAAGKAIVSTPYWYAQEMLQDDRGIMVPFRDSEALSQGLRRLLTDLPYRNRLRKNAYDFGRKMIWKNVSKSYIELFDDAIKTYSKEKNFVYISKKNIVEKDDIHLKLPPVHLSHLKLLTDETGIMQHALYNMPNRNHGYCIDDNARAFMALILYYELFKDQSVLYLLYRFLSFIHNAFDEKTGRFLNFLKYDRTWIEDFSEDAHARTLLSLATAIQWPALPEFTPICATIFEKGIKLVGEFTSTRGISFSIIACDKFVRTYPGAKEIKDVIIDLSEKLMSLYRNNISDDWVFSENTLTYDNARQPQALIRAGQQLGNDEMINMGIKSLRWLIEVQTNPETQFLSIVGNRGWFERDGQKAQFDQQPIELSGLSCACVDAYFQTGDKFFYDTAMKALKWFLGENDSFCPVARVGTGGCYDGLEPQGVNKNMGAESTISYLMTLLHAYKLSFRRGD
jgi:glycosyltransferase involved in cell wall biosynthesis